MSELQNGAVRIAGVEVSVVGFRGVSLGPDGSIAATHTMPLDRGGQPLPQLSAFIKDLQGRFGGFDRVGIAVPGLIDLGSGRVTFSAHIPEHSEIDLAEYILTETGINAVVENDANAGAYGEYKLGAGRGSKNMFYATLGRGIGGALIFDGTIWRGASGFAGEFGYMAIDSDGLRLEDVASTENIVRRTRDRFNRDSTSSLNNLDETSIHIGDIVTAAESGDDFARLMLERTGRYVGTAVATVINLLNIETIVLGGVIMTASHLVLDAVINRAKELSFAPSFRSSQILSGSLGENAAAAGVALLAERP